MLATTLSWRFSAIERMRLMALSLAAPPSRSRTGAGAGSPGLRVVREAEDALGEDVALDLARAAADRQRRGEQEAVVPERDVGAQRPGVGEHAARAGQVLGEAHDPLAVLVGQDRKSTRLNSSQLKISYAVFCLKKKNYNTQLI